MSKIRLYSAGSSDDFQMTTVTLSFIFVVFISFKMAFLTSNNLYGVSVQLKQKHKFSRYASTESVNCGIIYNVFYAHRSKVDKTIATQNNITTLCKP